MWARDDRCHCLVSPFVLRDGEGGTRGVMVVGYCCWKYCFRPEYQSLEDDT